MEPEGEDHGKRPNTFHIPGKYDQRGGVEIMTDDQQANNGQGDVQDQTAQDVTEEVQPEAEATDVQAEGQTEEPVGEPEATSQEPVVETVQDEVSPEVETTDQVEGSGVETAEETVGAVQEEAPAEDEAPHPAAAEEPKTGDQTADKAPAGAAQGGFQDQPLTCRECGSAFVWTAGEQEFYAQKGFDNPPVRCPNCRQLKKQQRMSGRGGGGGNREGVQITCSRCGKQDMVPFAPKGDKPVLCWDCYRASRS